MNKLIFLFLCAAIFAYTSCAQRIEPASKKKKTVDDELVVIDSVYFVNVSKVDPGVELPDKLAETSGMLIFRDGYLTQFIHYAGAIEPAIGWDHITLADLFRLPATLPAAGGRRVEGL